MTQGARRTAAPLAALALLVAMLLSGPTASAGGDASPAPSTSPGPVASGAPVASPDPVPVPCPSVVPQPSPASPSVAPSDAPGAPAAGSPAVSPAASGPLDPCLATGSALDMGEDGRLTVLALGSDFREPVPGERMDVILVMSLDPVTRRVVAASVPRDTVFFPQARGNGGGNSGTVRVNALYEIYRRDALPHGRVDRRAMRAFEADVELALGIEIDYWAMTRFKGFGRIIELMGGVRVDIPEAVRDETFRRTGAFFPAGPAYRLRGLVRCALDKPCRNVLIYVRSRKGTVGSTFNSDWERARRQQQVIMAATQRALTTDVPLAQLVGFVTGRVFTDMPRDLDVAGELLRLAEGARLAPIDGIVFGPNKWAYANDATPNYTYRLRLDLVREWMADRMHLDDPDD